MTPERWKKLEVLFHEALGLPGETRAAFLAEACGGDEQLRAEAERLIAAAERESSFIDSPIYEETGELTFDDRAESPVGHALGPYQVISQLGRGGMGEVYLAEDSRLNRKVALKVLPAACTRNPDRVRRFEREAKAASALSHPNILTIYEIGQAEGLHFMATEFVDGVTLRQRMESSGMSVAEALEVALQIAGALAAAHEAGIVHRDIKPENVMVRRDGLVKVLDFGLAKLAERSAATSEAPAMARLSTEPGVVMGTVDYMSPEQARGLRVDHRTDIFSLGVVTYELVAGRRPFEGETANDVIVEILRNEPPPISRLRPSLPPELEPKIGRMLEKEREARYQSAAELRAELQRLQRKVEAAEEAVGTAGASAVTAAKQAAEEAEREGAAVVAEGERLKRRSLTGRSSLVTVVGLVALVLAAVIYVKFFRGSPAPPSEIQSLAVLPFANGSADPQAEYLGDGITESLVNKLSRLPGLRVKARSTVSRYKGQEINPQQVGRALGVQAVLTGMVAQRGNSLVVQAELVRVADGAQIWGEHYNRQPADLFLVQEEVARNIVEASHLKLTGAEQQRLARRYTENIEAYNLYLKGRYSERQFTEERVKTGISYFRKAIEKDPNYALAYTGLADSYVALGTYYFLPPTEAFAEAREAARRAVELDETLAEAYVSLAIVRLCYDWDWPDYERNARRARELNPSYAKTYYMHSQYLAAMGRFAEAIAEARRAQELESPLDLNTNLGWILYFARRYDEAIAQHLRAIEIDHDLFRSHRLLGLAYLQKHELEKAIAAIQQSVVLSGRSPEEKAYLGYAQAASGRRDAALKVMRELREEAQRKYVSPYLMGLIAAGLGDKDETFARLDEAYAARSVNLIYLKVEPIFDGLHSDPRWKALLRRMNFTEGQHAR